MKGMKIGIDFGTSSLKIFAEGKGIVVDEPSIAAVETETGRPIAFGRAADAVYGRCVDDIKIALALQPHLKDVNDVDDMADIFSFSDKSLRKSIR